MKKILLIIITLFTSIMHSQPVIEWQKSIGGSSYESARNATTTSDGGYVMVGYTKSNDGDIINNHGEQDVLVVKINDSGTVVWQKVLGGSASDYAESIQETADGYIIAGGTYSTDGDVTDYHGNSGNSDAWIIKLNFLGEIQWQKTFGTSDFETATKVIATNDGGYIAIGEKKIDIQQGPTLHSTLQYWIIKLNSNGTIAWEKTYGGIGVSTPYEILQTSDNSYIVAGQTSAHDRDVLFNHGGPESEDIWVLKLNSSGEIIWQKCLGGSGYERLFKLIPTIGGGYIIAGDTGSSDDDVTGNNGFDDAWIVKINDLGTIEWQKNFGGSGIDYAFDIFQNPDQGYTFCGFTTSNDGDVSGNHGQSDAWLVNLDASGNVQWQKTFGGSLYDNAFNIKKAPNGGFFMSGYSESNDGDMTTNLGIHDLWVAKLSTDALSLARTTNENILVYPNPATEILNINLPDHINPNKISIYDISGKIVVEKNEQIDQINIDKLSSGLYFLEIISATQKFQTKFIKQ